MGLLDTSQILRPELSGNSHVEPCYSVDNVRKFWENFLAARGSELVRHGAGQVGRVCEHQAPKKMITRHLILNFQLYPPPPPHRRHTPPLYTATAAAVTRHRFHRRHRHHHYHRLHTTAAATTTTMCFSVAALVVCFSVSSFAFFFSIRCHSRSLSKFGVKGPIGNFKHMFSSARALRFISFSQRWNTPKSTGISSKYTINGWMIAFSM